MPDSPKPETFEDFQNDLTAYRKSFLLLTAHELGIARVLGEGPCNPETLCKKTGMDQAFGKRFLTVLGEMGLIEEKEGSVGLSPFSRRFLTATSTESQAAALDFEKNLVSSWQQLTESLRQGKRVYNSGDKSPDGYKQALTTYLSAMDDAARIRACELWDRMDPGPSGLILDAGAGSGAYLAEFLKRHDDWHGVFCDLPDVVQLALGNDRLRPFFGRMDFKAVNYLEQRSRPDALRADLVVCSNLIHCQGAEETKGLLANLTQTLSDDGCLVVHDFFTDQGMSGALYDLHMMLNTYNGRTYTVPELCSMTALGHRKTLRLPSGSLALVFSRASIPPGFFV